MWNEPSAEELAKLPKLYKTEEVTTEEKEILMHLFLGSSDWYITEYDPKERLFFGYVVLNGDLQNAEWGYSSLDEIKDIKFRGMEIDRDLHWQPKKFADVRADLERRYGD